MNEAADIQTLATRVVYENRWMRVREDSIRRGMALTASTAWSRSRTSW
jgi:hypothetical protein